MWKCVIVPTANVMEHIRNFKSKGEKELTKEKPSPKPKQIVKIDSLVFGLVKVFFPSFVLYVTLLLLAIIFSS